MCFKLYIHNNCLYTQLHKFHQHLNSVVDSINFTFEVEVDGQLPFLDVLVRREVDGLISTSVYRKNTHTDQYLQFTSHHPTTHKSSVVCTLFHRAERLSSSIVERCEEEEHVVKSLIENGYPRHFIKRQHKRHHVSINSEPEPTAVAIVPYIQGLSESIKRILHKDLGIKTIFTPTRSLRQILSHPKDPIPMSHKSGVVYRIPCEDCEKSYVGQTLRTLDRRIKEHQRSVITGDCDSSALAEHAWSSHHQIAWRDVTILHQHQRWFQRCILESWSIHQVPNLVNRDSGNLPQPYWQLTVTSPTELELQPTYHPS